MSTDDNRDRAASEPVYLELSDGKSHKFYEATVNGTEIIIRYGRIGTTGQSSSTTYATAETAQAEATKKINEKLKKGYLRISSREDLPTPSDQPTDAQTTQGTVALAPTTTAGYTGTRSEVHATVKPETETVNRAINTEVVQSPQPELPLPSITLLNISPFAPPRVAKEHLRQIDYPSAFSFWEYLDCSMTIPLPRSLVALEMVGTFNNLAASSFTLTLQAQNNIAYMLLFRPNEGYLIQHTGGDGENAGEQRVKIPASLASGQVFQLVVAITGKRDFVLYLNNQPFRYTPRYRPDKPIDQVSLNYDTSGLRLQLFRGLEPRGAGPSGMSQKPAIAVPDSQPKESPTLSQEQNMMDVPEFLRELPSQFEPFRPFLEANLVPYIKVQETEVQNQSIANVGSSWCHDPLELWQSKIGGHPYLPKGRSYPADRQTGQLMMFLMQINCADLPVISSLNLPKQGILQFYIGLDVAMCELSPEQHRVLYFPEVSQNRNDLITDFSFLEEPASALEWYESVYTLSFSSQQDVFWDARRQMDDAFEIPEALQALYEDFNEWISDYEDRCSRYAQSQGGRQNKLGGYPELHSIVGETIEGARGHLLLELQHEFNSDDNFYFFIEETDLASRNFNSIESYFLRN